jgi:hypothetical protein
MGWMYGWGLPWEERDLESRSWVGLLRFGDENTWPLRLARFGLGFLLALAVYGNHCGFMVELANHCLTLLGSSGGPYGPAVNQSSFILLTAGILRHGT